MSETENRFEPNFENRIDLSALRTQMEAVKQEVKKSYYWTG